MRTIKLTDETISARMKRLVRSEDFRVYQELLGRMYYKLIEHGKKVKTSEAWAAVEGFDLAASAAEKWAEKKSRGVGSEKEEMPVEE